MVSHRNIADFLRQGDVERYDKGIRQLLERLMLQSQQQGLIAADTDINRLLLSFRSMLYGLARMNLDRHVNDWMPQDANVPEMMTATLKDFVRNYIYRA